MQQQTTILPVITKDGQNNFDSYKKSLEVLQESVTVLANSFAPFEEIAGAYSAEWMRSLISGNGVRKLNEIIKEASKKEKPQLRATFSEYYQDDLDSLDKAIRQIRRLIDVYLTGRETPYSLRNLQGLSITQDGKIDLSEESLSDLRPLFNEVLTRPQDIAFYNLLHETADQINKLIEESEKRGLSLLGNSYTGMFIHGVNEKVVPQLEGLKFKLSIHS